MSMPADTPAAVMISPSSTKRASGRSVDPLAERREQLERAPVRRRRPAVEQPGVGEHQRAGADARHQRAGGGARADPLADPLLAQLAAGPDAARVDEHVDRARAAPRCGRRARAARWRSGPAPSDSATVRTSTPSSGQRSAQLESTSHGPAQSSSSASSNRAIAMRIADQPSGRRRTDDDRRTLRESRLDLCAGGVALRSSW